MNPNGSGGGSNGGGNGHGHGSSRGCGGSGPGNALWLRPIHNLLQHHQHQHCRLSNGGQHTVNVATAEHVDRGGHIKVGEELEMKSLTVRRGSANGNSDNPTAVTQRVGSLLGRLNGGMNYPTILPSFVCSYSSKTPPPHSKQCGSCPEHPPNHPASEHAETLTKLYQLMGQHSKKTITAHRHTDEWVDLIIVESRKSGWGICIHGNTKLYCSSLFFSSERSEVESA